ncbi:MAG: rhomboid family intramembrane serine protease [Acidobacteria bacterium]|nr:MAG: rhomboid family intramembrane serine protease [Acidobacteriota bacterium]
MFPYKDENPSVLIPVVTIAIVAVNVACWIFVQGLGNEPALSTSVCELGLIPAEFLHRLPAGYAVQVSPAAACVIGDSASWYSPLTAMFLHGGWFHLLSNMWFLIVFGDNVEDAMGHARYAVFYVLTGLAAAAVQMMASPGSPVPMVGASGAISGVMGAYVILYPLVRVHTLVFLGILITRVALPAYLMLGYWFLIQLLGGLPAVGGGAASGVAFWAHVGGFVAGALLIPFFKDRELLARQRRAARLA